MAAVYPGLVERMDEIGRVRLTGAYWRRHGLDIPPVPEKHFHRVRALRESLLPPDTKPWQTLRDALADLPEPSSNPGAVQDHRYQPGAKPYAGHTGSPLDLPAKTLKAGDHGVPGGENMLARPDGSIRYFTVREAARLQTFPDDYVFQGAWSEAMRQLGNAVPVRLAETIARSVASTLEATK